MLLSEWDQDEFLEVRAEEAMEKGREEKALETAKNFLGMGLSPEQVAQGTGLDIGIVKNISLQQAILVGQA
jgi:predicted transposase/invertase (TIGR01784 family)